MAAASAAGSRRRPSTRTRTRSRCRAARRRSGRACVRPIDGTSQRRIPPNETRPTRSFRARWREARRTRRADGQVERARSLVPRLGEGVDEEDHVRVPLRVRLVDPELAATRAGPPVDPPDAVAGHERTHVGELDAVPFEARHLVSGEGLRLAGADDGAKRLLERVDAEGAGQRHGELVAEEPERVAGARENRAGPVAAPAIAATRRTAAAGRLRRNRYGDGPLVDREAGRRSARSSSASSRTSLRISRSRSTLSPWSARSRGVLDHELQPGPLGEDEPQPGHEREGARRAPRARGARARARRRARLPRELRSRGASASPWRSRAHSETGSRSSAAGVGTRLEALADHVVLADLLHPDLGPEREPVGERRHRYGLHVVGRHVVAAREGGPAAASFRSASVPRGLAPTCTRGFARVAATRSTM